MSLMLKSRETKIQTDETFYGYLTGEREMLVEVASLISYLKTSLTLIVAGATLVETTDNPFAHLVGWGFVALGGWLAVRNHNRFNQVSEI